MTTNPYSAGGGGTHLEARVVASCLAAVWCEAPVRGLLGDYAIEVRTQRAAFGDPLDDIAVYGLRGDGRATQLHLQIKNKLTFTANDEEWVDVVGRAWAAFTKEGFDITTQRLGVGIGTYHARADQHYQSVLGWASHSTDAEHFFERIEKGDYSHQDKQAFVAVITKIIADRTGTAPTPSDVWRFLKAFVIVHFDFQTKETSRDAENVIDRIRGALTAEHRDQARAVWDHLVSTAGELVPVGGGATRSTLSEALTAKGFPIGAAPSLWRDIRAIERESVRALSDIKTTIHGLALHRADAYQQTREALADARFVQINGEPGCGKSALLKLIAEESARNGPVFMLKDVRIHPKGWRAHAHVLGISDDIRTLLREFACAGEPILFIDGIDKITDPAIQLTVNDLLKAIANEQELAAWRVLITVREQNLKHLETWLDPEALKKLPLRTVAVGALNDAEISIVAGHFPTLGPLLTQTGGADVILRRPFFLEAILGLAGHDPSAQLPTTEVELLKLWWMLGASDRTDFSAAQHRRNVLMELADRLSHRRASPIAIRDIAPEPLEELKSSGVLRDKELGHSVVFTHDIYEEWTLCQLLIGKQLEITAFLKECAEPDLLVRSVQLLGAFALETSASADDWKALYEKTGDTSLRPVWQRAILTSCLQSTRTTLLLTTISNYLFEQEGERLKKLLLAISTLEVIPNPLFLNEKLVPGIEPEERAKFAHHTAIPKPTTWVRFLDWLMPQTASLPPVLIPAVLPVFSTWQNAFAGQKVRHCRQIGQLSHEWLKEFEAAHYPRQFKDYRQPFGGAVRAKDLEKTIRALFLTSAGDVPKLASEYLSAKTADHEHVHVFRDHILSNCGALIRHFPSQLVDFVLAAFLEHPKDDRNPFGHSVMDMQELGLADHYQFYPASPVQLPFLGLLRMHEAEGLRLIRSLCNHAIAVWRWLLKNGRRGEHPAKPLPVSIAFPWGTQEFWGDAQTYLWFRGVWGNHACQSGLMALEQWALEAIEGGANFDEVFRKVIEENDSVAALGIGVSLCLAYPGRALQSALPLVLCPHLWQWDIARYVQDLGLHSNEIGNWFQNRVQLMAVRELNQKPHRKQDIRNLTPYIILSGDQTLIEQYTKGIQSFPDRLPFSYEHERDAPDYAKGLREQMKLYVEQGDPQFWRMEPTADGKYLQLFNDAPSKKTESFKEQMDHHADVSEATSVAFWAYKTMETGQVESRFTPEMGLAKARQWERPDLFDIRDANDFDARHHASAVVGAAFVVARFASDETWTDELAAWTIEIFERAATAPEASDQFSMRLSAVVMHPAVAAAHGYSALLARGYEVERCRAALLNLAVDALQVVQAEVFKSGRYYADRYPDFLWSLLDLGIRQCIVARDDLPNHHSVVWDERESERLQALIDRAETNIAGGTTSEFMAVPMPWIKGNGPTRLAGKDTKGYVRNETLFLHHLARETVLRLPHRALLADPHKRKAFLKFVSELTDLTIQEIIPPFAKRRREAGGHTPYEWVFDFSAWCGRLCAQLTNDEVKAVALSRIFVSETETSLYIMQSFLRGFMFEAFLRSSDVPDERITLWHEMAEWLLQSQEWRHNKDGDHLDREFQSAAFCILFCVAPDFSPLVCGVDPGWLHLRKFEKTFERAITEFGRNKSLYFAVVTFFKRGGLDLLPDPGLDWLSGIVEARKQDQEFWKSNGEDTVELLKLIVSEKRTELTAEHQRVIAALSDVLIDNGVRGASFFQQELARNS